MGMVAWLVCRCAWCGVGACVGPCGRRPAPTLVARRHPGVVSY